VPIALEISVELELPAPEGRFEQADELPPEDAAQDPHWQEKLGRSANPPRAVGRQPARGDDTVQVWVVHQVLAPGVQYGQEANLRPQSVGIGCDRQQRGRRGLEEQVVKYPGILQGERTENRREREDDVEVRNRQELPRPGFQPAGAGRPLTLGTVAVTAGVVRDHLVAAPIALLRVTAQRCGTTGLDVPQHPPLMRGGAMLFEVRICVLPENVGDLEGRSLAHL